MASNSENPLSGKNMVRLRKSVQWSREQLRHYVDNRARLIRQNVGPDYDTKHGQMASSARLPKLSMAIRLHAYRLSGGDITALITAKPRNLQATAISFELALKNLMAEIRFGETAYASVHDALFCMGIVRVGVNRTATVEVDGFRHDVGQPYADIVDLEDWVQDMAAARYEEVQYAGNDYDVPKEQYLESGQLSDRAKDAVFHADTESGDDYEGSDKIQDMTRGKQSNVNRFMPCVRLRDLWLPHQGVLMTTLANDEMTYLSHREWDGPEWGPYNRLTFGRVQQNAIPAAPAQDWAYLTRALNKKVGKFDDQADRQKTLGLYRGKDGAKDAENIRNARDGTLVGVSDPESVKEFSLGGVDQTNFALFAVLNKEFDEAANNLSLMGGFGPQSDTARQDELLNKNAGLNIQDMQKEVIRHYRDVITSIAFYMWHDPYYDPQLMRRVPGTDIDVPVSFSDEDREGDFLEYQFSIDPHSVQPQSPGTKLAGIYEFMDRVVNPYLQMMQQQGMAVDFESLSRLVARYLGIDDVEGILKFIGTQDLANAQPQGGGPGSGPAFTQHTSERVNRPGASRQGQAATMIQAALGGNPQQSEMDSLFRNAS